MNVHNGGTNVALQCVLAITDLSPASINSVWRAALIARERGVPLRLLHAGSERKSVTVRHTLENILQQVTARLGIEIDVDLVQGDLLPKAIGAARSADLMVIGSHRSNTLLERIRGTQAERLMRLCRIPTLVVKRPATPGRSAALATGAETGRYGKVLVSVNLRPEAVDLISTALRFSRDSAIHVFHALGAGSVPRQMPAASTAHRGHTAMQRAEFELKALMRSSGAEEQGAVSGVAYGVTADCVLARERAIGAELVVVGKRRRGLLADFILGSVTQQVLARSHADVLMLPSGAASSALAVRPA